APIEKANDLVNKQKPHYVFTLDDSIEVDVATVILAPSSETLLIGKVLTLKECSIEFEAGVDALIVNKSNVGFEFKSGLSEISYRGHPREVDLAIIAQADKKKDEFEQFLLTNDDINVVIFSAVIDCQQAIDRLPNAHVSQVFEYYKKMKQFIPDLHANSFKDKVKRLRHKEEVAEYIQLFEERELLIDILTPDCLITLIDIAIKQSDVMDGLFITQALTDLAKPYASLKNKTAVDLLTLSNFELLKLNVPLYKLLNELSDQIDVLYKMLSASVFNNSTLGGLREKTSDALAHFNAKYADPQQINKRVVVIDTNCLMHNLNLLDRVKPS
ncbi:hypothetical protein H5202_23325, partial [Shewanella sp. SG41-4]|uniref:hypothetical protein n=1 Tax=Shewanella sp. SG41-4 TaxID=2760976 RepID=UPI0016044CFA